MKWIKWLTVAVVTLGVAGGAIVPANASSTTVPKSIRGTYYSYGHLDAKMKISAHKVTLKLKGTKPFVLTSKAKHQAKRIRYKKVGKYFKLAKGSYFPSDKLRLVKVTVDGEKYHVLRNYTGKYEWDYIKGTKLNWGLLD
ncbi:hypothetical protein FD13_GL001296 [Levilactobacillus senmaizukei DSM 21775 = NBRC 103853]|uniref:DUF5776 domain-containing protein n=1 Tax=Levilactobacillus senmaizukei DSM 21775 = NBRC 103853 TaxID=1423803 RepID=A0A0R2DSL7_9LACO|nr:hypothetical protein [Levilactobacillus senmaizukei]KRN02980.1 hypothetical protein FD13_GL001296 [Levilactobacillus senmaizukei DSM 21775 = NBRC 103853]